MSPRTPFLSIGATDLASASPSAMLGGEPVFGLDHGDDRSGARLELVAHALLEAALHLVFGELADDAAGSDADGDRGEQRRSREADEHAHTAAPAHALAAEVVAGLRDADLAALVVLYEDETFALDCLVLDERDERVEVLLGRFKCRVGCQDQIERVAHGSSYGVLVGSSRHAG